MTLQTLKDCLALEIQRREASERGGTLDHVAGALLLLCSIEIYKLEEEEKKTQKKGRT